VLERGLAVLVEHGDLVVGDAGAVVDDLHHRLAGRRVVGERDRD
jgi:hypothetical protein